MKISFFLQLILFGIFIYIGQLLVIYIFPYSPPPATLLLQSYKKNNIDILYFGDSTVFYVSKKDTDVRATSDILNSLSTKKHAVGALTNAAWNQDVYYAYSKYMKEQKYFPKYIIVPINLHSFSIAFDLRPMYQFTDDMVYFKYYNTFLSPFLGLIDNLTTADINQRYNLLYKNSLVYDGETALGSSEYFENMSDRIPYDIRFKNIIAFYYMASINPAHRKLTSLTNIINLYKNTKTKVLFYISPVDYQTTEKYYGKNFKERISKNVGLITSKIKSEGGSVIDLSFALQTNDFTWQENEGFYRYIDEHINSHGRNYIANKLAEIIDSK